MGQSSGVTGPELFQDAGFCGVSWQFIQIPDGMRKEQVEVEVLSGLLFCYHWKVKQMCVFFVRLKGAS